MPPLNQSCVRGFDKTYKDTEKRLEKLFRIPTEEREFRLEEETSVVAEKPAESMTSGMTKAKPFSLIDLDDFIEDRPVVKQEQSKTLSPSVRVPTTRQKSAAQKKRKATTSAETEPITEITVSYAVEKLQTYANFLASKVESYHQISQEAELSKKEAEASKKEAEAKLADLLKSISIKDLLLKKKDKEILDLKASFESEKDEFLEDAKKCAAATILESKIKMCDEVHAKGYVMESWNFEAWKKKLKMLRGEDIDEEETTGTSGVGKDAEAGEGTKETETGETKELEKKEGDGVEGEKA